MCDTRPQVSAGLVIVHSPKDEVGKDDGSQGSPDSFTASSVLGGLFLSFEYKELRDVPVVIRLVVRSTTHQYVGRSYPHWGKLPIPLNPGRYG